MSQKVTVPGVGTLEFPDGMSQPDMAAAIQQNFPQIHQPKAPQSFGQTVSNVYSAIASPFAKEIPDVVGSMASQVAGSLGGGLNYLGTLGATQDPEAAKSVQQATQQALSYQPRTGIGKAVSGVVNQVAPYVGQKEGEWAGNKVMDLTNSPALATAANLGANVGTGVVAGGSFNRLVGMLPETAPRPMSDRSVGAAQTSPAAAAAQGSPDLSKAVTNVQTKGSEVNPEVLQRKLAAESIGVKMTEGQATQDPVTISNERNIRAQNTHYAEIFNKQEKQIVSKLSDIRDEAGPDVYTTNQIDHGDTLIDAYKAKAKAATNQTRALYKQLEDSNGGQFPVDAKAILGSASKVLHDNLLYDYAPKELGQLQRFAETGDMTFENFESMRTNLARIQRSMSIDGNTKAAAGVIRNELEKLPLNMAAEASKQLADAARQSAKAQFQALDADPAYKAAVNETVPADRFVQKFVVNGARDDVALMRKNLANNPEAVQTLGVAAVDHLRQAATGGKGVLSQAAYNKALAKLAPKLNDLVSPQVANSLQTVGDVANWIQARPAGEFVNSSNTGVMAAAGRGAASAVEKAINYKFLGLPVGTFGRGILEKRMAARLAQQSLSPEAGLDYQMAQQLRK